MSHVRRRPNRHRRRSLLSTMWRAAGWSTDVDAIAVYLHRHIRAAVRPAYRARGAARAGAAAAVRGARLSYLHGRLGRPGPQLVSAADDAVCPGHERGTGADTVEVPA